LFQVFVSADEIDEQIAAFIGDIVHLIEHDALAAIDVVDRIGAPSNKLLEGPRLRENVTPKLVDRRRLPGLLNNHRVPGNQAFPRIPHKRKLEVRIKLVPQVRLRMESVIMSPFEWLDAWQLRAKQAGNARAAGFLNVDE
jgi:hypothetical protein